MDEQFDPEKWTEKELMKFLYREVKKLNFELRKLCDGQISMKEFINSLDMEINKINTKISEREKESDRKIDRIALICTIVGLVIAFIALFA